MTRLIALISILLLPATTLALDDLRILLTNDDGYESPGIKALQEALVAAGHDVYLIAPATQQSGASSSVTSGGFEVTQASERVWAVHGRPADAVRFGLGHVMKDNLPDLVVSGANFGNNSGEDVMISGTVGAALTALQLGIPAIAVSVEIRFTEYQERFPSTLAAFPGASEFVAKLINRLRSLSETSIINVNYPARPAEDIKGVVWADLAAHSILSTNFEQDEDGKWASGLNQETDTDGDTDVALLAAGYITLARLNRNIETTPSIRDRRLLRRLK